MAHEHRTHHRRQSLRPGRRARRTRRRWPPTRGAGSTRQINGACAAHPGVRQRSPAPGRRLKAYPRWIASLGTARDAMSDGSGAAPRTVEGTFREQLGPIMQEEVAARLAAAASTPTPFRERLVWFWSNHFTVSAEKALVFALVGSFEREAIRPHVGGRFADMLLAATRHPAMILYLDNHLSVRKGWQARGLRASRSTAFPAPTGLNENLAREILELHTLGVNGGYTQADVTEFARVLTGWTVRPTMFDLDAASPASCSIPNGMSPDQDTCSARPIRRKVSRRAKRCCATSPRIRRPPRFVATKLARHFIADEPPPDAVARIARAFRDSGGHLPTVYAALLDCPEAWQQPLAKLKSPIEYVVSCLRALPGLRAADPRGALRHASRHGAAAFLRARRRKAGPTRPRPGPAATRSGSASNGRASSRRVSAPASIRCALPTRATARHWARRRGAPSSARKVASRVWRSGSPARNFSGGRHEDASTSAAAVRRHRRAHRPARAHVRRGAAGASSERSAPRVHVPARRHGRALGRGRRTAIRSTPRSAARSPSRRRARPAARSISTATSA